VRPRFAGGILITGWLALTAGCGGRAADRAAPAAAGAGTPAAAAAVGCPASGSPGLRGRAPALSGLRFSCLGAGPAVDLGGLGGGRPVLINVWATWCLPCQRETPRLQRAHQRAGCSVLFLGVDTLDSRPSAQQFLQRLRVSYPQLADTRGLTRSRLHSPGIPITLAVRADGSVAFRHFGEMSDAQIGQALRSVQAGLPTAGAGSG